VKTILFKRYIRGNVLQDKRIHFWTNGDKKWFLNGLRHNENGPATIWRDGYKTWWLDGINYSEKEYKGALEEKKYWKVVQKLSLTEF